MFSLRKHPFLLALCRRGRFETSHWQGFWYFAEKKAKFRGIFRGKFAEKSADFAGFSREESQNSLKNRPISGIFSGKKSKFAEKSADFAGFSRKKVKFRRIFRGKFLEKSADFTGNFVGKLRHETISKKQLISLDFGGEIWLKSINFASMWPALFNVFFNRDNHLLFQQQFAREMSELLKLLTLWLVPSFSQRSSKNAW